MNVARAFSHLCSTAIDHLRSALTMPTRSDFLCSSVGAGAAAVLLGAVVCACVVKDRRRTTSGCGGTAGGGGCGAVVPESVNYHLTRQCNYKCGFCFHTAKTSFVLPLEDAKRGLKLLLDAGEFHSYISSTLPVFGVDTNSSTPCLRKKNDTAQPRTMILTITVRFQ